MKIAVLGNGPSLDAALPYPPNYDLIVGTNRLIFDQWFVSIKNSLYVAADERFLDSQVWRAHLVRFANPILLSKNLHKGLSKVGPLASNVGVLSNKLPRDIKQLRQVDFPLMNVVLDYVLPHCFSLSPDSLDLYGVDLDYGVTKESNLPKYWSGYSSADASFDHGPQSADAWASQGRLRLEYLANRFRKHGCVMNRMAC